MAVLLLIIIGVGAAIKYKYFSQTQEVLPEKPSDESAPKSNNAGSVQLQDFPSSEAGTFTGILRPQYFKEPMDNVIILFASVRVPGLIITYYPEDHKMVGGTPQMVADGITFFDGISHELRYSFQRNGQQLLLVDGKVVASSPFVSYRSTLTGAVIGTPDVFISKAFEKDTINIS